jgi:hypothetical protein
VSQIAVILQKKIVESYTLYQIMPFAKIIGPVKRNTTKRGFIPIFSCFEDWHFPP